MKLADKLKSDGEGIPAEYVTGALVIGALLFLILVKRGFRGVNVAGISLGVK